MTRKILIIDGHPDPAAGRYLHALAEAYAGGARGAGHAVRTIAVGKLRFTGVRPVRASLVGMVEGMSPRQRERWLARAAALGRKAE